MEKKQQEKLVYASAEMEVVLVQSTDIICTSPGPASNEGFGDFDDI